MAELQDRIILLNGTPTTNPPSGISYVFVDGNGKLKQLDSAGNTTEYIPKSGADFADMPLVGGDSIVASGSNSDGSWVKYADGTMICWVFKASIDVSVSVGGSYTVSLPLPISFTGIYDYMTTTIAGFYLSGSGAVIETSLRTHNSAFSNRYQRDNEFGKVVAINESDNSVDKLDVHAIAIGTWK